MVICLVRVHDCIKVIGVALIQPCPILRAIQVVSPGVETLVRELVSGIGLTGPSNPAPAPTNAYGQPMTPQNNQLAWTHAHRYIKVSARDSQTAAMGIQCNRRRIRLSQLLVEVHLAQRIGISRLHQPIWRMVPIWPHDHRITQRLARTHLAHQRGHYLPVGRHPARRTQHLRHFPATSSRITNFEDLPLLAKRSTWLSNVTYHKRECVAQNQTLRKIFAKIIS